MPAVVSPSAACLAQAEPAEGQQVGVAEAGADPGRPRSKAAPAPAGRPRPWAAAPRYQQVAPLDAVQPGVVEQPPGPREPAVALGRVAPLEKPKPSQNAHRAARPTAPSQELVVGAGPARRGRRPGRPGRRPWPAARGRRAPADRAGRRPPARRRPPPMPAPRRTVGPVRGRHRQPSPAGTADSGGPVARGQRPAPMAWPCVDHPRGSFGAGPGYAGLGSPWGHPQAALQVGLLLGHGSLRSRGAAATPAGGRGRGRSRPCGRRRAAPPSSTGSPAAAAAAA